MLKFTYSCMLLLVLLSIFGFNKVESRVTFKDLESILAAENLHPHLDEQRMIGEHHGNDQDGKQYIKRKSDMLLSLYGLPYTLVNKRNAD